MGQGADKPAVTVVVPVYRDLQATRDCLNSLAVSTLPATTSVLVIDDQSPEEAVSQLCHKVCAEQGFELLVNEQNLGFVGTANRGLTHAADNDVILLNSDTMVSGDWVQRLQVHAYAQERTATVTPFSNDATICSYPVFPLSNSLPEGWNSTQMDELFAAANAGLSHPLPTGVGFCMYIRRASLEEIGLLDEANFGQGYGEECDFSLRAASQGWTNLIAADVFVYHSGSASFAGEAEQRKHKANQTMLQLHPGYSQLVSAFLQTDPLSEFRQRVDQERLAQRPEDQQQVLAEHRRYSRSILDRFKGLEQERLQLKTLLAECRDQFQATDEALSAADDVVTRQQQELQDMDAYARRLVKHIETMEQSRSWRYTTWLRRKE